MHSHTREVHGISWLQIVIGLEDNCLIIQIIQRLNKKVIFLYLFVFHSIDVNFGNFFILLKSHHHLSHFVYYTKMFRHLSGN